MDHPIIKTAVLTVFLICLWWLIKFSKRPSKYVQQDEVRLDEWEHWISD